MTHTNLTLKFTLLSLVTASLTSFHLFATDAPRKTSPRFKARIVCFNGKLDSNSSCSGTNFQPDGTLHAANKMTCGFPGQVSEIECSFVERRGDKDVYRFTRRFPSDTLTASTTSKTVESATAESSCVRGQCSGYLMEPPKK